MRVPGRNRSLASHEDPITSMGLTALCSREAQNVNIVHPDRRTDCAPGSSSELVNSGWSGRLFESVADQQWAGGPVTITDPAMLAGGPS